MARITRLVIPGYHQIILKQRIAMARITRLVIPGYPHHITQRGNRRQETFFCDDDYLSYMRLVGESCEKTGSDIWAYCLMPNHIHLVIVPSNYGDSALNYPMAEGRVCAV